MIPYKRENTDRASYFILEDFIIVISHDNTPR